MLIIEYNLKCFRFYLYKYAQNEKKSIRLIMFESLPSREKLFTYSTSDYTPYNTNHTTWLQNNNNKNIKEYDYSISFKISFH